MRRWAATRRAERPVPESRLWHAGAFAGTLDPGLIEPAIGLGALARGEAEQAATAFAAALDVAKDRQVRNPEVVPYYGDLIEALVMTGRAGDAIPVLEALQQRANESGRGGALAIAARSRGMLAPADGFETHFTGALHTHPIAAAVRGGPHKPAAR